jgi:hypothetical protein
MKRMVRTRYDYNLVRKRDFRIGKSIPQSRSGPTDDLSDSLEKFGKALYADLQTDPPPFIRNYAYKTFKESMKLINSKFPSFQEIKKLDLSNQLLGDEKFQTLCLQISRSSVQQLNISGNLLTDQSINCLSGVQRSLHHLEDLNVSNNCITDTGVSMLLGDDCYCSSIRALNLSCNELGPKTAFFVSLMFSSDRQSAIDTLILGGRVGKRGWGDLFLRVLVSGIVQLSNGRGLQQLKTLYVADAGLTRFGVDAVASLLVCEDVSLKVLNISKNHIGGRVGGIGGAASPYRVLLTALRMNDTLEELHIFECGLTKFERSLALETVRVNYENHYQTVDSGEMSPILTPFRRIGWEQQVYVAYKIANSINHCHAAYRDICFEVTGSLRAGDGLPQWQVLKPTYDFDILSNFSKMFDINLDHLPSQAYSSLKGANEQLRIIQQFHEATLLARMLSIDSSNLKFNENGAVNKAKAKGIAQMMKDTKAILIVADDLLEKRSDNAELAKNNLFSMLNSYCVTRQSAAAALSATAGKWAAKRAAANLLSSSSHAQGSSLEKVTMAAEDYFSAVQEQGEMYQKVIGEHYKHRMLHYCLLQEHLSAPSSNSSKSKGAPTASFDAQFYNHLKKSMPYYKNLGTACAFVHYFYMVFPKEKDDNAKREAKLLQQFALEKQKEERLKNGDISDSNGLYSGGDAMVLSPGELSVDGDQKGSSHLKKKVKKPPAVRYHRDGTVKKDMRSANFRMHDREAIRAATEAEASRVAAENEAKAKEDAALTKARMAEEAAEEEQRRNEEILRGAGVAVMRSPSAMLLGDSEDGSEDSENEGQGDGGSDDDEFNRGNVAGSGRACNENDETADSRTRNLKKFMQIKQSLLRRLQNLRPSDFATTANNTAIARSRGNKPLRILPQVSMRIVHQFLNMADS